MPVIYEHDWIVETDDIDSLGHVNNLVYISRMIDAAVAHSKAQGWSTEKYQQLGAGWVVRSHRIEYMQPAFLGDRIVVKTWVSDFRRIRSTRHYLIMKKDGDDLLANAQTDWVWVSYSTWQPRRIPDDVIKSFAIFDHEGSELR